MFDKLIESDTAGAEFKDRSRYFMASSVVVGILFLTAVVYSLYASEVGLGNVHFDIAELVSPIDPVEPEKQEQRQPQPNSGEQTSTPPNRNSDMARVDEPTVVPTSTSVRQNPGLSRTWQPFDPNLPETLATGAPSGGIPTVRPAGSGSNPGSNAEVPEDGARTTEPPPVIKPVRPPSVKSEGVINGKATYLPIPPYPPHAKVVRAYGTVHVQVTISEDGKVISAKAISGHPFLRTPAERSAWNAKFSPTYLSRVPVKVTGVIVYNFKQP